MNKWICYNECKLIDCNYVAVKLFWMLIEIKKQKLQCLNEFVNFVAHFDLNAIYKKNKELLMLNKIIWV